MAEPVRTSVAAPQHLSALNLNATVLPMVVRIARLPMDALPAVFFPLLRLMFFQPSSSEEERFFQCSVTDCVSLVLSAAELTEFPPSVLEVDPTEWRVVEVSEGKLGSTAGGVVERITGPLAAASLPVMFVSTVSHDYVLIPADRLDEAMRQFSFRDMLVPGGTDSVAIDSHDLSAPTRGPHTTSCQSNRGDGGVDAG